VYPSRPVFVWLVYFGTWEGEGSRASRRLGNITVHGTALARLFQTVHGDITEPAISEPETALPLTNGKQGAGAAQRRPRCRASS
jgi:hypothetical protein